MGSGMWAGPCGPCTPSPEGEGGGVSQAQLGEPPRRAMPSWKVSRWKRWEPAHGQPRPRVWNSRVELVSAENSWLQWGHAIILRPQHPRFLMKPQLPVSPEPQAPEGTAA